ncbi:hypothetical protein Hanom_Chr12g01153171 [Helianthus anomalus]
MEEMKWELRKQFNTESSSKAMSSESNRQDDDNRFSCLEGESHPIEEIQDISLDEDLDEYLQKLEEEFTSKKEEKEEIKKDWQLSRLEPLFIMGIVDNNNCHDNGHL